MDEIRAGSAAELLPHTRSARMLDQVVRHAEGFLEATGHFPATHPLVRDGRAPCFLGLDLGAQAAAALEALQRQGATEKARARIGHLVRVRSASFAQADVPADTPVGVTARLTGSAPPLAMYEIAVTLAGAELLRATLSTYLTEEPRVD